MRGVQSEFDLVYGEDAEANIIPAEVTGGAVEKFSDDDFALATKAGDYLPRLQLMTANSDKCKGGEFPINHYALVSGQNFTDLGEALDIAVVTWRPKALEIDEEIISVYDPEDAEFKRIQAKSDEKDSGCMFGPEFLVYIPSKEQFATFFMGSKSSRREAPNLRARVGKAATLKSHFIETKKYSWYAPTIVPCSTPMDIPPVEAIQEQVEKFNNPPASEVEKIPEEEVSDDKRER